WSGVGRQGWPLLGGLLRVVIAIGGGWLALHLTGSLGWVFAALSMALVIYGVTLTTAIASGAWFGTTIFSPSRRGRGEGEDGDRPVSCPCGVRRRAAWREPWGAAPPGSRLRCSGCRRSAAPGVAQAAR